MDTLGKRLKYLREERELSAVGYGKQLGVNRQTIHSWERDAFAPSLEHLKHILIISNASADWVLFGKGEPPE